jgi:hypothetical protein
MLEKFRREIARLINPAKNAMRLPSDFLKYGGKSVYGNFDQIQMLDQDLYTGYPYGAITRRANKVARLAKEQLRTESLGDIEVHPYLQAINDSRTFSNNQFWRWISTFLDLEGVYYLMAVRGLKEDEGRFGKVKEFKLLNPYNIQRILSADTLTVGGYRETRKGMIREIPKDMIIEIRDLNPFSEDLPFSMTDAAKDSQFTLKTSQEYTRETINGNLNAPGIISTDIILEPEDFKNVTENIKKHKKGEPLFANGTGALGYTNMNIDLGKAGLKEIHDINLQALMVVSGMSKTSLGIEESGTTRDTAKVQKDLLTEDHIMPRIEMIIDALNQDYQNHYPDYLLHRATIVLDNPLATDHDADLKDTEVKQKQFDLYTSLINKGYDTELAWQYVQGEILLEDLGEPTNDPIVDPLAKIGKEEPVENRIINPSRETQQEASLQNAVVNIQSHLVAAALNKIQKNKYEKETDVVSKEEKKSAIDELALVLLGFYGILFQIKGSSIMTDRKSEFALGGQFILDNQAKKYIDIISKKVAKSHVETITSDILASVRESALAGLSVPEIQAKLRVEFSGTMSETRAKTIARTETNRAFTRAQYEADRQFIKQNGLEKQAFKQWQTRSDNPCPFCLSLEAEGLVPFDNAFRDLGDDITVGEGDEKKTLGVNFEALEAGNAHPNCSCQYVLIIKNADNSIEMEEINRERAKLEEEKRAFEQEQDAFIKLLDE